MELCRVFSIQTLTSSVKRDSTFSSLDGITQAKASCKTFLDMNYVLRFLNFAAVAFVMFGLVTSCGDSDDSQLLSTEDFVGASIDGIEAEGKIGRGGCYEFIFPISINFADGSTAELADYSSLRIVLKTWKENNPDSENRPTLSFPVEVMSEDGSVISVASKDELKELRRECRRAHFDNPRRVRNFFRTACFDVVFPVTLEFPNGSTLDAATPGALKTAIRAWRQSVARPVEDHPRVVFPITVGYEDGTQVEAANKEALKELKDQCADGA